MRRVMTALVLAGTIALALPYATYAQRGGGGHAGGSTGGGDAGGFSGGHGGGFSGGGFTAPHFAAPSGGFAPRTFSAPHMNFMPGPSSAGYSRIAPSVRPYSGSTATRSPFGQLSMPAVRRAPYPGGGNTGWSNHNGNTQWHGNRDG